MVRAKGKGVLATFWLTPNASGKAASVTSADESNLAGVQGVPLETGLVPRDDPDAVLKHDRLVEWIAEIFLEHIRKIVAQKGKSRMGPPPDVYQPPAGKTCLDEVAEVIKLPKFYPITFWPRHTTGRVSSLNRSSASSCTSTSKSSHLCTAATPSTTSNTPATLPWP